MKHPLVILMAVLALGACSGNSIDLATDGAGGGGDDGGTPVNPDASDDDPIINATDCTSSSLSCAGDVTDASYNSDTDVLTIVSTPFDEEPTTATYVRANTIDNSVIGYPNAYGYDFAADNVNGYAAYENDDPVALNPYLALYGESPDGTIKVGQVAIMRGYRDFGYGGTFFESTGSSPRPDQDLAVYKGAYAGIVVFNGSGDAFTSEGDVYFEVDFTDEVIRGGTDGRTFDGPVANDPAEPLGELTFDDTFFTGGDTFTGQAINFDSNGDVKYQGTYSGVFGADDQIGGVFQVDWTGFGETDDPNTSEDITSRETGIYIIPRDDTYNPRP